jgi:3-oxoacyl-[acyl-carrier protein] reductase
MRLKGKTALVTGAARGIGRATAAKLLSEGAKVTLADRDTAALDTAVQQLSGDVYAVELDVTDAASVRAAVEKTIARFGRLDILVNNAGITRDATLAKLSPDAWNQVLAVNLTGTFQMAQAVVPHFVDQRSGVILNASSVVGLYGNFGQTNYVASKAGVIGLTRVWARELGRKGIRVNCVAPGFIATDMTAAMPEEVLAKMKEHTPLQRLGAPEDIAAAYAFLASDDASFINGQVLGVDGGLVLGT